MKICRYCDSVWEESVTTCPACGANEFSHKCENCGSVTEAGLFCSMCGVKFGMKPKKCPNCGRDYYTVACPDCGYVPNGFDRNGGDRTGAEPRQSGERRKPEERQSRERTEKEPRQSAERIRNDNRYVFGQSGTWDGGEKAGAGSRQSGERTGTEAPGAYGQPGAGPWQSGEQIRAEAPYAFGQPEAGTRQDDKRIRTEAPYAFGQPEAGTRQDDKRIRTEAPYYFDRHEAETLQNSDPLDTKTRIYFEKSGTGTKSGTVQTRTETQYGMKTGTETRYGTGQTQTGTKPTAVRNGAVPPAGTAHTNVPSAIQAAPTGKKRSKWVAFALCLFLGWLGVHKFYEGKIVLGVVYLFTYGLFFIGCVIDLILILTKPDPYYV